MSRFLIVFISVYSFMHAFVFMRIRSLMGGRWLIQALCILLFLAMIFAPIAVRLLESNGYSLLARIAAHVAYPWLGFIFLCFCAFLTVGVLEILLRLLGALISTELLSLGGNQAKAAVLGLVALTCIYGFFEARNIRVEHVRIETAKLPEGVDRLKIAQISDVHLGLLMRYSRLQAIIDKVRAEGPDILVSTGDLVDGNFGKTEKVNGILRDLRPRFGKYAITGNHEYYAGIAESIRFTEEMGFKVLRGKAANIENIINVVGVDDPVVGTSIDEVSLLSSSQNGLFTLFLKHRPDVPENTMGLFDLQLSGHTHLGQIFPFRFITGMVYPMQNGRYDLKKGSTLYTSRGTGTWGPPMRVLAPPEVTVIELVRGGS